MVNVADIKVWGRRAGAVSWDNEQHLATFEYHTAFFNDGWDLSPIKMPLTQGPRIFRFPELRSPRGADYNTYKGLPGLLADVLPDRYGNRLIDQWLLAQGREPGSMNPVEQLCFIGERGMGALEFEPAMPKSRPQAFDIEIDSLVKTAHDILQNKKQLDANMAKDEKQALVQVLKVGTSAGGARPKAVIAYNPITGAVKSGQTIVPPGFEHWLIKLDGVDAAQFGESYGWGRVEFAYYLMAKDCGIDISECRLLEENGRAHFLTKRFDREGGGVKHHIQTWCAMQHYDYNEMLAFSYEQLFQTMRTLHLSYPEAEEMFRRMVFNVLATNCDDHTKNFSFRMKQGERWTLAPAYDLCFAYDANSHWVSQQTLSVNGKRQGIGRNDLLAVAHAVNVKKGAKIIDQVNEVLKNWPEYADKAGVRDDLREHIEQNLHTLI